MILLTQRSYEILTYIFHHFYFKQGLNFNDLEITGHEFTMTFSQQQKRRSFTQLDSKADNTCSNMPKTDVYSSTTTEDQHVVKMTNPTKA